MAKSKSRVPTDYIKLLKYKLNDAERDIKRIQSQIDIILKQPTISELRYQLRQKKLDAEFYRGCLGDNKKGKLKFDGYEDLDLQGAVHL